ncbi:MAG: TolB family protein, partial [Candidatus Thorarchaeota archaeon]
MIERNKLIEIDDLFNLKQITDVSFRPNTNELYFTINQANKEDNSYRQAIWTFRKETKQFTQGLPRDGTMRWSPDGGTLAFISTRGVLSGESKNSSPLKPQIFLISADGGEALQLTTMINGVNNFEWSKDGKTIIFISRLNEDELQEPSVKEKKDFLPEEVILMTSEKQKREEQKIEPRIITREEYRAGTSFKDDRKGQIFTIDIATKEIKRWTSTITDDYTFAFLANDNSYCLTARQKPGEGDETRNWEIIKISPNSDVTIIIDNIYVWGAYFEPSPNGKFLISTIDNQQLGTLGQSKLCLYDIEKKSRIILA